MSREWVMEGGGILTSRIQGLQVCLEGRRPEEGKGLYKVWVLGAQGQQLLGTMMPQGDGLEIKRTLSRQSLERAGCWPIMGGKCQLVFPFGGTEEGLLRGWRPESQPQRFCQESLLQELFMGQPGCLSLEGEGANYLALPFSTAQPFPAPPLFCLAHIVQLRGQWYAVLAFDLDGIPVLRNKIPEKGTS